MMFVQYMPSEHGLDDGDDDTRTAKRARQEQEDMSTFHNIPVEFASEHGEGGKRHKRLSCAECRRLKLKCDRVFPCQSCTKRGCKSICPDGRLTAGKGSRFILADTRQLHDKVFQMSDRIRELEDALRIELSAHPLLSPELMRIKATHEIYNTDCKNGLSPVGDAAVDVPLAKDHVTLSDVTEFPLNEWNQSDAQVDLPADILQLSASFPVPWMVGVKMRQKIRAMLPPFEDAKYLCQQAHENALWQYNLDHSETITPNLLLHVYTAPLDVLCSRRLALLFMVLAIGRLVDINRPFPPPSSEKYHHLARASLTELPIMEAPNLDMLHVLFYMAWYMLVFLNKKKAVGYAWSIMGLTAKLAQSLGLHRDTSGSKVIPEELQKKRWFFWELLSLDTRLALSLGRPPSLSLRHVDCQRPSYANCNLYPSSGRASYHEWKHTFFANCLSPILEATAAANPPSYPNILYLDGTVRNFPKFEDIYTADLAISPSRFMQQAHVAFSHEIALLQLHRSYFIEAISEPELFTLRHRYAPSVLAIFSSGCELVTLLEFLYEAQPQLSTRFHEFWFNALSGAYALSLLVTRVPSFPLAPFGLQMLDRVRKVFAAVTHGHEECVNELLPLLAKLHDKPRNVYQQWHDCMASSVLYATDTSFLPNLSSQPVSAEEPFQHAHPFLAQYLEQIKSQTAQPMCKPAAFIPLPSGEKTLPSMNEMANSFGLPLDVVYSRSPSTPYPNSSRIPQAVEMDFGALSPALSEDSWMTWF